LSSFIIKLNIMYENNNNKYVLKYNGLYYIDTGKGGEFLEEGEPLILDMNDVAHKIALACIESFYEQKGIKIEKEIYFEKKLK